MKHILILFFSLTLLRNAVGQRTYPGTGDFKTVGGQSIIGTGDIPSSGTATLPNTGTAGTYGTTNAFPIITTDAQGRVTNVSSQTFNALLNVVVPLGQTITAAQNAYASIPSNTTATIMLTGDYLRTGTESLTITDPTKTVYWKTYSTATIKDLNNTATSAPLVLINNQTGGGFDGISFYTSSNYGQFNYGLIFINETQPVNGYFFKNGNIDCPNLYEGNGLTISAWSQTSKTGTIHRNILIEGMTFGGNGGISRMGGEYTAHNDDETNVPTRMFNLTVRNNRYILCGTKSQYGMGSSFSGYMENVTHTGNYYGPTGGKQYVVEFIGVRSFVTANNTIICQTTWGTGTNGTGTNLTNGYNFTDGGNANLGCRNGTVTNDIINVSGRPMLFYGVRDITLTGGNWTGGLYIDINKNASTWTQGIKIDSPKILIKGTNAQGGLVINNAKNCSFVNMDVDVFHTSSSNIYSVINVYGNCSGILLTGGVWRRPTGSNDNLYNFYGVSGSNVQAAGPPPNSQPVGPHIEEQYAVSAQ